MQDVLGHASLQTTSVYVRLAQQAVRRELQEHALQATRQSGLTTGCGLGTIIVVCIEGQFSQEDK